MAEVIGLFPTPPLRVKGLLDGNLIDSTGAAGTARKNANVRSDLLSHTETVNPMSGKPYLPITKLAVAYRRIPFRPPLATDRGGFCHRWDDRLSNTCVRLARTPIN